MSHFVIASLKNTHDSRLNRAHKPISPLPHKLISPLIVSCVLCLASCVFFCPTIAQASVSGSTSYTYSFTNDTEFTIPAGMSITITASASISGTMTITGPGGYSNTISVWGPGQSRPSIKLGETGTYNVSESFHLEATAGAYGKLGQVEDSASSGWSFDNSVSGGIATFHVSSSAYLSKGGSSGNLDLSVSGMSATATATAPIKPGDSASATVNINWSVDTSSPSIEIPPGTIEVRTNLASATFSVDGYRGGGKFWTETSASAGQYTITYGDVSPVYETPRQETKTLSGGGKITFEGIYKLISPGTGTIQVQTNLSEATFNLSSPEIYPEIYSGDGTLWTKTEVSVGEYTITYDDVPGYRTPPLETKILTPEDTITFIGEYIGIGTIEVRTNLSSAVFDLSGPANYVGGRKFWTETEAIAGEYTITYGYVSGYKEPPPETKTLTPGGTISFTGEYRGIGAIEVYTNLATATFSLSGPESYSGEGRSWTETRAATGEYTITYDHVPGYGTPPPETKALTSGGRITFLGNYKDTGTIKVTTNLASATFSLSGTYASYDGKGSSWVNTEAVVGEYTITYGDVPGYEAPTPRRETLGKGGTITFTGTYTPIVTAIQSVSVTGSPAGPDGAIAITVIADPDGSATFSIANVASGDLAETPSASGTYTESFTVPQGIEVKDETVEITFTDALGLVSSNFSQVVTVDTLATISSVELSSNSPTPGDLVTITVVAEPSGSVSFSITDIASGVMEEDPDSPGTYTADFAVTESMEAVDKPVEIEFTDAFGNVAISSDQMITIEGLPGIRSVKVSGVPAKAADTIVVSMSGDAGGVAAFSIAGIVSDIPMPESASTPGLYTGEYVVPEGVNATDAVVSVKLISAEGTETINEGKTATIDTMPPAIESVDISGSPATKAGDIITVSLVGEPGGLATFSIADIAQDIPMQESEDSPGTYQGSYSVVQGVNVEEANVVVRLADAAGNASVDESRTASISTIPWDVNGDSVVDLLDIEAIGSNMGKSPTPELDLNGDGAIDVLDLALVGMHFGEEYGQDGELLAAARPLSREALDLLAALYMGDPAGRSYVFQNYPNPCNPGTWIPFALARGGEVVITIYSPTGQLIRRLDLGYRDPGIHISKHRAAYWDGRNELGEEVASGVYFYHVKSGDLSTIRKMLISK